MLYRPDIDGLRAVAVLAVIGFHAFPSFVPGGFVGVDVFFAISGFLISGLIFEQLANDRFSFWDFYARRIRRIVPALVVLLIAIAAIGWAVLVSDEFLALQKHIAAAATFTSNIVLWHEAGYFDAPSDFKPLLHLWSLAIEEQFYLLWPFVLWASWRRRLHLGTIITGFVVGSFALNLQALHTGAPTAAFFLPQCRLWQLLGGALLAYIERFRRVEADAWLQRKFFAAPRPEDG